MKKKELPLYMKVKHALLRAINNMEQGKNRLPTELELVEKLQVSRSTLREAINALVLEKVIKKQSGKPMVAFPSVNRLSFRMDNYADFKDLLAENGEVDIESTKPRLGEPSNRMLKRIPEIKNKQVYTWTRNHYLNGQLVIEAFFEAPVEHYIESSEGSEAISFDDYIKKYVSKDIAYHISWIKSYHRPELAKAFNSEDDIIESWDQVFKDIDDRSVGFCQLSFHPDIIDLSIVIVPK